MRYGTWKTSCYNELHYAIILAVQLEVFSIFPIEHKNDSIDSSGDRFFYKDAFLPEK